MNLATRMVLVLTSVGIISGGFLASVGKLTKERIALNKLREIEEAVLLVVPGSRTSEKLYEDRAFTVYGARDEKGEAAGFALLAAGVGFQDKITMMVGLNPEMTKIHGLTILDQKETPGLGAKITSREDFLAFWDNKDCTQALRLRKPAAGSPAELSPAEVNTITGATISAEAVLNTVNTTLEQVKRLKTEGRLTSGEDNGN